MMIIIKMHLWLIYKRRNANYEVFSIVILTAMAMLGVKYVIECLLYSQPFVLRTANNIYAFVADVFVLIFSLLICHKMHQLLKTYFPEIC